MGQRLVITVVKGKKDIAKIYYHWSAYTESALDEAKKIIDDITKRKYAEDTAKLRLGLIRFCEENGGGVDGTDFSYVEKQFPGETFKEEGRSRNDGLIAISKKAMNEMQKWSEGDLTIDLDDDIVYNDVIVMYEDISEYLEWYDQRKNEKDVKVLDVPEDIDITAIPFDGLGRIISFLDDNEEYDLLKSGGSYYELIR